MTNLNQTYDANELEEKMLEANRRINSQAMLIFEYQRQIVELKDRYKNVTEEMQKMVNSIDAQLGTQK